MTSLRTMKKTPKPDFASTDKVMSFMMALSYQAKRVDIAAFCLFNLEAHLVTDRLEGQPS